VPIREPGRSTWVVRPGTGRSSEQACAHPQYQQQQQQQMNKDKKYLKSKANRSSIQESTKREQRNEKQAINKTKQNNDEKSLSCFDLFTHSFTFTLLSFW